MIRRTLAAALVIAAGLSAVAAVPALKVAPPIDDVVATSGGCDALDPAHCLLPWPSDQFTRTDAASDTGRRLDLDVRMMPRNVASVPVDPDAYNRNDGFSPGALIVTRVPGLDTPEALAATAPVGLTDLSRFNAPDAPVLVVDAETGARHPVWAEIDANSTSPEGVALLIRPAVNFTEGARYIAVLRNLRDGQGAPIAAQPAFAELRDGASTGERAEHFDQNVFPVLDAAGVARDESLYLAWDFTVASERNLSERMLSIRDDAFAELGDTDLGDLEIQGDSPTIIIDTVSEQLPCRPKIGILPGINCDGELDARVLRRVEGRIVVPCYLDQPGCPTGSRFLYAGPDATVPTRIPGNTMTASFTCNVPAGAAEGETFRPSLYGHGLLGSQGEVNSGKLLDLAGEGLMFCATDWVGMATEDIPNALSVLAELGRFPTLADRVQQGMLNFLYLGRAMIHPDGFAAEPAFQVDGESVIDTSRLYYNGGSQGGIIGGALASVAPDFTQAHLGVPAMNYSTLLRRSVDFDTYAIVMENSYLDELERPLLLSMIQTLWDRAENNGYAAHISGSPYPNTPDHRVLMNVAYGDHQVTNWASEVMARTIGVSLRDPSLDPGRHPAGDNAYWGIDRIEEYPFAGSAMIVADIGPLRDEGGRTKGTTPLPVENVPNRAGVDPHGPDASETAFGYRSIGAFLSPAGHLVDICGDAPCYLDGWAGPPNAG